LTDAARAVGRFDAFDAGAHAITDLAVVVRATGAGGERRVLRHAVGTKVLGAILAIHRDIGRIVGRSFRAFGITAEKFAISDGLKRKLLSLGSEVHSAETARAHARAAFGVGAGAIVGLVARDRSSTTSIAAA
jgi:hypothetical protein